MAVFHVLDNDRWLEDLEQLPLERAEVTGTKQSLVELLFLLAAVEVRFGDGASGARWGIALLNQVEALAPNLLALYEYRGRYRTILGDHEAARSDSQRAGTMQRNTWLDHYFRAIELRPTNSADALREAEAALTFRPDDYWSWFVWSDLQGCRGGKDLGYWGFSICIRLRPEEPRAWMERARGGGDQDDFGENRRSFQGPGTDHRSSAANIRRIRMLAYRRLELGQPEAALSDCNSALRLGTE